MERIMGYKRLIFGQKAHNISWQFDPLGRSITDDDDRPSSKRDNIKDKGGCQMPMPMPSAMCSFPIWQMGVV